MSNTRPQSEIYREAAMRWADLDAAARMLEDSKSAVFSQRVNQLLGDFPNYSVAKAELKVKGSDVWQDYIDKTVRARTQANKARIEMEFTKMVGWEKQSRDAYERQEMRLQQ